MSPSSPSLGHVLSAVRRAAASRIVPGRPGAARLRAVLDDRPGPTRSEAERLLLAILRRARFPNR